MRRRQVLVAGAAAGAAALLGAGPLAAPGDAGAAGAQAAAVRASGSWGRAITVPGPLALNTGRNADVLSVSCPSAGNCAAGGYYQNHGRQGFVVSKVNGRWRQAIEVPGLGALNKGGPAQVSEVSCASAGSCAAGGFYRDGAGHQQGFVAVKRDGRWRQAIEVPGLVALNAGANAAVSSVSCASPGNCAAGGYYGSNPHDFNSGRGFVAVEQNGRWHQAIEVPGLETLNTGGNAAVSSVSCASAGNCSAGGNYADASGGRHAFVVSERNGSWGTARQVAGNLNTGADARVDSVSCASAGNCAAGGQYKDASGNWQAFVISEVNGTWGTAREIAGNLNINGLASVTSVSCASAGNCSAGGTYDYDYNFGFVVSEKNGVWGKAINVPGLAKLAFRFADVFSVSCATAGNCAAGGDYETAAGFQGFVAVEKNGVWGKAIKVPGLASLGNGQYAAVESVSCATAGSCAAGGYYSQAGRRLPTQGFVT